MTIQVNSEDYGRLKPEFLNDPDVRKTRWPLQKNFPTWLSDHLDIRVDVKHFAPLKKGHPVPWKLILGTLTYFETVLKKRFPAQLYAEFAQAPDQSDRKDDPIWRGWGATLSKLTPPWNIEDKISYCNSEEDVRDAAKAVVLFVGRMLTPRTAEKLSDEEALEKGEAIMKRSTQDYFAFLMSLWKVHRGTVIFINGEKTVHGIHRHGVCVAAPLTPKAYMRFVHGEISDRDFVEADFVHPSSYILISAATSIGKSQIVNKLAFNATQINTMLYQLATLSKEINSFQDGPSICSIKPSPEASKRLKKWSFQDTGSTMPGFDIEVVELAPPKRGQAHQFLNNYIPFTLMSHILHLYQQGFRKRKS